MTLSPRIFGAFVLLAMVALLAVPAAHATVVTADGFASSEDCGWGLQTVAGFHSAVINFISEEHLGENWTLEGYVETCSFFVPQRITHTCVMSGNTLTTQWLTCNTRKDIGYFQVADGVRSRDRAVVVNHLATLNEHSSTCTVTLTCDDDPKF